jgi:hypothetical protein
MSIKLSVRVSVNFGWGIDYFELTENELENDYRIYAGGLFKKSYLESKSIDTDSLNFCTIATAAELFNYELLDWDNKETVEYCKKAYDKKYPDYNPDYQSKRNEIIEKIAEIKQCIKNNT